MVTERTRQDLFVAAGAIGGALLGVFGGGLFLGEAAMESGGLLRLALGVGGLLAGAKAGHMLGTMGRDGVPEIPNSLHERPRRAEAGRSPSLSTEVSQQAAQERGTLAALQPSSATEAHAPTHLPKPPSPTTTRHLG